MTLNVDNFFTIEELSTLRQAETERQLEALVWFIGDFLESVAGRRTWGKLKYFQLVNEARDQATGKTAVTASDEAFALLLFENYSDKWFAQYKEAMEKDDNRHDNRNLMEATVQEKKDSRESIHQEKMDSVNMEDGVNVGWNAIIISGIS